ncbi:S66 peptidase family protein [Nakamurella lactea]|uniref:S66 peptidase family protein n=1 Tax=Nakamurella lactea TaxID=459515 RepID=UPI000429CCB9|nr:LD-carboxypeptidase [Nakamurella lactea]
MTNLAAIGPLRAGDRVAMVATAGPATPEQHDRAVQLLKDWGLQPVSYPSVLSKHPRADYLAAPDLVRSNDFERAWCDPEIAGIFCLRGGYGSVRMLDGLDAARMRAAAGKPVYGSSDVTAVHEWLREQLGAAGWFTPMIGTDALLNDAAATDQLRAAVFCEPAGRRWTGPNAEVLIPGTASGVTIGGNLSLLAMTLGARNRRAPDNAGTIALLEDINEETYKVDGYLQSLLRAGWFDGVTGVALGSWQDCETLDGIRELFVETLTPLGVPVAWELAFGHCAAANSIPLGVRACLVATSGRHPELILQGEPADGR